MHGQTLAAHFASNVRVAVELLSGVCFVQFHLTLHAHQKVLVLVRELGPCIFNLLFLSLAPDAPDAPTLDSGGQLQHVNRATLTLYALLFSRFFDQLFVVEARRGEVSFALGALEESLVLIGILSVFL